MKTFRAIAVAAMLGTTLFAASAAMAKQPEFPKPKPLICAFIPYLCDLGIL